DAFGAKCFSFPCESITVGINDLTFIDITTLSLPGGLSGSLLEFGGIAVSWVEFDSANGETISVAVFLSKTNVAVCGWCGIIPTCISCGTNTDNMSVAVPPPDALF